MYHIARKYIEYENKYQFIKGIFQSTIIFKVSEGMKSYFLYGL